MNKDRRVFSVNFNEQDQALIDCRTFRGFPLGGIGNGGFNFYADGCFGEFRTQHNWFRGIKAPKGTFFAIWTKSKEKTSAKILRRNYRGEKEFLNVKNVKSTKFVGKIPQFSLEFKDDDIPVKLRLNGFSPLIPQNLKDSSLPVAIFKFTITNPSEGPLEVALLFSFENILGLGGSGCTSLFIRNGPVKYKDTTGNYAEELKTTSSDGIIFKTTHDYSPNDPHRRVVGQYAISFINQIKSSNNISNVSKSLNYDPEQDLIPLWDSFSKDGTIKTLANLNKKRMAGAIAVKFHLDSKASIDLEFLLSWFIPYYVIEKSPRIKKLLKNHNGIDHGHYFLNFFENLTQLTEYAIKERERLYKESCELQTILESSILPNWLITLILNMTDSIIVNSVFTKTGNYYTMEGVPWKWQFGALTGTNDQRLSSHPYTSVFFPTLDKAELEAFRQLTENGKVPHGNGNADLALTDSSVPYGKPIKLLNKTNDWIDLTMSEICQIGKLILITGDTDYLKLAWGDLKKMMEYLNRTVVNGVPEGGSTYDVIPYHPCFLYSVVLYLATLAIMVYLGELMIEVEPGLKEEIEQQLIIYKERFRIADNAYNDRLWKKKGYYMVCQSRDTLFQGGLAGDWIIRYTGLKPVVEIGRARTHSAWQSKSLVDSHLDMPDGKFPGLPLSYSEATPEGKEVKMKVFYLRMPNMNYFWQVLSYQAFEAIYLSRVEAGYKIIRQLYEKLYKQGYPWDANLFALPGFVYMTHPVMWAFFNAITGAALDAPRKKLILSPRMHPDWTEMKIPFFFPKFWAMLYYNKASKQAKIEILKTFDESFSIKTILNRKKDGEENIIDLKTPFQVKKGATVSFSLD